MNEQIIISLREKFGEFLPYYEAMNNLWARYLRCRDAAYDAPDSSREWWETESNKAYEIWSRMADYLNSINLDADYREYCSLTRETEEEGGDE